MMKITHNSYQFQSEPSNIASKLIYFITGLMLFFVLTCLSVQPSIAQGLVSVDSTDTQITRQAPDEITDALTGIAPGKPKPFGANLFTGAFQSEREDGINPNYVITPGDRITLEMWGATTFSGQLIVDSQGNVFLPDIGPVLLAGVRNSELNEAIYRAVRRVYTQNNVDLYTNLISTQPVVVYVTGFVRNPGSYAGTASDSPLYFLDRSGGIDLERGSFREIHIKRNNRIISTMDLYDFLLDGRLPKLQFVDGDTIVVTKRRHTVVVEGDIQNAFDFEILADSVNGDKILNFARPKPGASHVAVVGVRKDGPISAYLPIEELSTMSLQPGDRLKFEADQHSKTMLVRVQGEHLGPSRFSVPVNVHLLNMLQNIEVDPNLADTSAISIRRKSVAVRQKQAIEESLRRLETASLSATSQTDAESQIRLDEAKLVADFVQRAKEVEPEGVLVVARNGEIQDLLLQPEDIITIPEKTNTILVSGAVLVPQALVYEPGASIKSYIERVGGFTDQANEKEFLIVRRNSEILKGKNITIMPGDEIVVLPKIPVKSLQLAKAITEVIFQLAISASVIPDL